MSIDTETETLIPFSEATTKFPGRKKLAVQTLHRWRLHGVRGAKLETCLVGGFRYTSTEAIQRFIAAQNADQAAVFTPSQRQRQSDAARRELAEMGV